MKQLPVNLDEIVDIMEMGGFESEGYLDTETGETVTLPPELVHLEDRDESDIENLPDWEKGLLPVAQALAEGSDRYVQIPEIESYEDYNLMVKFAQSVADPGLRDRLSIALDGKGAFGRFRRVLENYPDERSRWFAFKDADRAERAREWLEELGITPIEKHARDNE